MKVIIAGSRNITDYRLLKMCLSKTIFNITEIVCGKAKGVDSLGERYAEEQNIICTYFPADWNKYGLRAGYIRNTEMGRYADSLIAIWDGRSKGTIHMIDIMKKLNKPYEVFLYYNGDLWKLIN